MTLDDISNTKKPVAKHTPSQDSDDSSNLQLVLIIQYVILIRRKTASRKLFFNF